MENIHIFNFSRLILNTKPVAMARVRGNNLNPGLGGEVYFYPAGTGTLVLAEVMGLPRRDSDDPTKQYGPFYAFHIHEGKACGDGGGAEPFGESGGHYNPTNKPHPEHVGDMPPLLADRGYAYLSFFTPRFKPEEVIGRTVIIHQHAEDFHTQPSGNAGTKIACGEIAAADNRA